MSTFSTSELAQLKIIEDEVNSYLRSKQKDPKSAIGVNSALNRVLPNTLLPTKKIHIIWNNLARSPFIMSITPDIGELDKKSKELNDILTNPKSSNAEFVNKWAEIKEWYIEIDTRVLTKGSRLCVTDGAQFVALLCHEVGHVMNESPIRLICNYKLKSLEFSTMEKMMLSKSSVVRAVMLPMYTHTLQFFIVVRDRNDQKSCEMAADAYVPDAYKGALVSYMNDHLLVDPDASKLVTDGKTFDSEQEVGITLARDSIEMLQGRRNMLNRQILAQYNHPDNGPFQKHLMKFLGKSLTGYDPETDKYITMSLKAITESSYARECSTIEQDAKKALMEAAKLSTRDLDILEVQVDNISTTEDKMYMIHKVYDYIEAIDEENVKNIKKNKGTGPSVIKDARLDRLNAIRAKILAKNVTDVGVRYGVFVKYPAGYEG